MPIDIRAFRNDDLAGVVGLLNNSMTGEAISVARFTRQVLLDQNFLAQGAPVAVDDQGRVVGFLLSLARQMPLENAPSDADRGYITLMGVDPVQQRSGVGSLLLESAEGFLREQNRKLVMVSSYAPNYFLPGVDVNLYAAGLSFFTKHGYKEIYRPLAMEVRLWTLEVPQWVIEKAAKLIAGGVTIEPYHAGLTLPLLEFARTEFMGDWVRFARQASEKILLGDYPERLMIAHQDGKVLGFSHHDAERFGPIGVAQSQRGRGIGQVLMYRTLAAQRNAGYRVAYFLWSDDKTVARMYTAAGFRETRRFALLKKELL
jgi:mycothiol synthase